MSERNSRGQFIKGATSPRKGIYTTRYLRECLICKKIFHPFHANGKYCSKKCWTSSEEQKNMAKEHLKLARKIKTKLAIGNQYINSNGYTMVFKPNHPSVKNKRRKQVPKHRLVMEKYLGRYLKDKEVVHHIDGNPLNNSINNLMLFVNHSAHIKYHFKQFNWRKKTN